MNEENTIFHWGVGLAISVVVLSATLQVFYRTQDRARRHTRADIVTTQQMTAEEEVRFSTLVQPEILRSILSELYPKTEVIGFNKTINVGDIPMVHQDDTAQVEPVGMQ